MNDQENAWPYAAFEKLYSERGALQALLTEVAPLVEAARAAVRAEATDDLEQQEQAERALMDAARAVTKGMP